MNDVVDKKSNPFMEKIVPVILTAIAGFTFWGIQQILTTQNQLTISNAAIAQGLLDVNRRITEIHSQVLNLQENSIRAGDLSRMDTDIHRKIDDFGRRLLEVERRK